MNPALVRDPIYCQVNDLLRAMIHSAEFQAGIQFLTERQIAERFDISRATANKALSTLVAEGLLEFRKGVGTFVAEKRLDLDLRSLVSFTEKARAAGKIPATQVLQFEVCSSEALDASIVGSLSLGPDEKVYAMERLRLADDLPVILEKRFLVARYCPDMTRSHLDGSLYAALSDYYKLDIVGAEETIRAVSVLKADADLLQMGEGDAGLLVTAVGFLSGGIPLWHEQTLYRGDAYEFRNRLGPLTTVRPAIGRLI